MAKRRGHTASTRGRQAPSGRCDLCGQDVTRDGVQAGLVECAPAHRCANSIPQLLVFLGVLWPLERISNRPGGLILSRIWIRLRARVRQLSTPRSAERSMTFRVRGVLPFLG